MRKETSPARALWLAAVAAALISACAEAPVTGRNQLILLSQDEAAQMGAQAYQEILQKQGRASDASLQRRVETVASRIVEAAGANESDWEFNVIADDTPNAFALPGGKIGVHTGLFKVVQNDAQLAAVIGHEVAHVEARHSAERLSTQALTQTGLGVLGATTGNQALTQVLAQAATLGVQLPFSRKQESEADEIGLLYMAKAGYDPRAAVEVWQNFQKAGGEGPPRFLSTHPAPGDRIEHLRSLLPKVMPIYQQNAR